MHNKNFPWLRYVTISLVAGLAMAAVGSAIAINMYKPEYEAKLHFRVDNNPHPLVLGSNSGVPASWIKAPITTQRVALDPRVSELKEIRKKPNKAALLVDSMTEVTAEGRRLYAIRAVSTVPENAAVIAETYWDKFQERLSLMGERQSKALVELLDHLIVDRTRELKRLQMELRGMEEIMKEKEGHATSLQSDYKIRKADYERQNAQIKSLMARREQARDLELVQPFEFVRETVSDESGVAIPQVPIEKYPLNQLAVINGLSFAAAFLVVGLLIFKLPRTEPQESAAEVS